MVTTEEGTCVLEDGTKLYKKTWKPDYRPPRATIAFLHGFSDHCNAYYEFFPTLASYGFEVKAIDQRGWGRSVNTPKHRGLTGPTSHVLSDIHSFLVDTASLNDESAPLFLMGHSMGGAQVLHYILNPASPYHLQQNETQFGPHVVLSGALAFSPFIALHPSSRPSAMTVALGKLAGKVLPRFQMLSPLEPRLVSRDEQVCADWAADPLCHDTGTLEGMAGMLDRALWLERQPSTSFASTVSSDKVPPVWIGHGTGDRITSFEATKRFVEALPTRDKTFKVYEGAYHKLHVEPGNVKVQFARDIADWILERSPRASDPNVTDRSVLELESVPEGGPEETFDKYAALGGKTKL